MKTRIRNLTIKIPGVSEPEAQSVARQICNHLTGEQIQNLKASDNGTVQVRLRQHEKPNRENIVRAFRDSSKRSAQ
ncbi:MAG: hypothetical protein GF372_07770 [Candidatus Marinimicrobia bacterium]|nr:hypothetical protein [Candidatus Neomarinimicrobiota bacterium]